jgi:hypothetical protein
MNIIFIMIVILLESCVSKVWVIQSRRDGGLIGYQNHGDDIFERLENVAYSICPNGYRKSSDTLRSSNYTYNMTLPVTKTTQESGTIRDNYYNTYSYSGSTTTTTSETKTYDGTTYWRELEIVCVEGNGESSNQNNFACNEQAVLDESLLSEVLYNCETSNIKEACYSAGRHFYCADEIRESNKYFRLGCSLGDKDSCENI